MYTFESFFQSATPVPRAALQSKIWSAIEQRSTHPARSFLSGWQSLFAGSAMVVCLGVGVITQLTVHRETTDRLDSLDTELSSLENDITQDPVITEAFKISP